MKVSVHALTTHKARSIFPYSTGNYVQIVEFRFLQDLHHIANARTRVGRNIVRSILVVFDEMCADILDADHTLQKELELIMASAILLLHAPKKQNQTCSMNLIALTRLQIQNHWVKTFSRSESEFNECLLSRLQKFCPDVCEFPF